MSSSQDLPIQAELESRARELGPEMVRYLNYRTRRYQWEAQLLRRLMARLPADRKLRMMDIGPSFQTILFDRLFHERITIDTFGFADAKFPPPAGGVHLDFDLNDAYFPDRWPHVQPYDLITMFAVIEHLYTSPVQVLGMLRSMVSPGGILVITTPNAAMLMSRVRLLLGSNPFEQIRLDRTNPGHYREYTRSELCQMGREAGLEVVETHILNLSSTGSLQSRAFRALSGLFPPTLRKELIVVFRNPA